LQSIRKHQQDGADLNGRMFGAQPSSGKLRITDNERRGRKEVSIPAAIDVRVHIACSETFDVAIRSIQTHNTQSTSSCTRQLRIQCESKFVKSSLRTARHDIHRAVRRFSRFDPVTQTVSNYG
jgi:hypothetical protein